MRRRSPSSRPAAFPPHSPPPIRDRRCSRLQRYYAAVRLLMASPAASSPRLPVVARERSCVSSAMRSPRFRRDPSVRDMAINPGRATAPRIAAPHMLPSASQTASAPTTSVISWLVPIPLTSCCVRFIAVVAFRHATLTTGPDFHRLDRASFAWRTHDDPS